MLNHPIPTKQDWLDLAEWAIMMICLTAWAVLIAKGWL